MIKSNLTYRFGLSLLCLLMYVSFIFLANSGVSPYHLPWILLLSCHFQRFCQELFRKPTCLYQTAPDEWIQDLKLSAFSYVLILTFSGSNQISWIFTFIFFFSSLFYTYPYPFPIFEKFYYCYTLSPPQRRFFWDGFHLFSIVRGHFDAPCALLHWITESFIAIFFFVLFLFWKNSSYSTLVQYEIYLFSLPLLCFLIATKKVLILYVSNSDYLFGGTDFCIFLIDFYCTTSSLELIYETFQHYEQNHTVEWFILFLAFVMLASWNFFFALYPYHSDLFPNLQQFVQLKRDEWENEEKGHDLTSTGPLFWITNLQNSLDEQENVVNENENQREDKQNLNQEPPSGLREEKKNNFNSTNLNQIPEENPLQLTFPFLMNWKTTKTTQNTKNLQCSIFVMEEEEIDTKQRTQNRENFKLAKSAHNQEVQILSSSFCCFPAFSIAEISEQLAELQIFSDLQLLVFQYSSFAVVCSSLLQLFDPSSSQELRQMFHDPDFRNAVCHGQIRNWAYVYSFLTEKKEIFIVPSFYKWPGLPFSEKDLVCGRKNHQKEAIKPFFEKWMLRFPSIYSKNLRKLLKNELKMQKWKATAAQKQTLFTLLEEDNKQKKQNNKLVCFFLFFLFFSLYKKNSSENIESKISDEPRTFN